MHFTKLAAASAVVWAPAVVVVNAQATAQVLTSKPGLAAPLPKDFLGLSVETTSWVAWAGDALGKPNGFVQQALGQLQAVTGQPLPIRIGGGTQEHLVYDANAKPAINQPQAGVQRSLAVSSNWFALAGNFPKGTPFSYGLNFGLLNVTETTLQAQALADAFQGKNKAATKDVSLELVELGNEVDFITIPFFFPQGPTSFSVLQYVEQFTAYVASISKVIDFKGANKPKLQIGDFANVNPAANGPGFTFPDLYLYWATAVLNSPLFQSEYAKLITTWAAHHYDTSAMTNPPVGSLFRRAAIRGNATEAILGQNQVRNAGMKFVLGETNSIAQSGQAGVSNTAEGALFTIDYALQLACNNVPRAHFHQGNGSAYNWIQASAVAAGERIRVPATEAHIGAPYYGAYVVQDFIGSEKDTSVAELGVTQSNIAGYALYVGNTLKRILLLNYDSYFPGGAAARRSTTITLKGLSGQSGTISRLSTPYTNSVTGLTYAGLSFETPSGKATGVRGSTAFSGNSVTLSAAEAVLIKLN